MSTLYSVQYRLHPVRTSCRSSSVDHIEAKYITCTAGGNPCLGMISDETEDQDNCQTAQDKPKTLTTDRQPTAARCPKSCRCLGLRRREGEGEGGKVAYSTVSMAMAMAMQGGWSVWFHLSKKGQVQVSWESRKSESFESVCSFMGQVTSSTAPLVVSFADCLVMH